MWEEGNRPGGRAQDRVAGRESGVHGAAPAVRTGAAGRRRAPPGVAIPPGCADCCPPSACGPAGRAGPQRPPAPRGPSLRALPGCASAPGAARAVGWGAGRLCRVPAGDARGRRGSVAGPCQSVRGWFSIAGRVSAVERMTPRPVIDTTFFLSSLHCCNTALCPVVRHDAERPGRLPRRARLGGLLTSDACDTAGVF
jgi:hypothetical protein